MKWFKHISDSLEDPFIFDLIEQFGHSGYVAFFGTIEVYAREFEPDSRWKLNISFKLLRQKLQFPQGNRLKKIYDFIKNNGKWDVKYDGTKVIIHIPKFFSFLDDTTIKKLREHRERERNKSGTNPGGAPEQLPPIDEDEDEDKDTNVSPDPPPSPPPDQKPTASAPSASNHFSTKVGDQLEAIKRHCRDIESKKPINGKRFNPWQWVTTKTNINGHPLAITQALEWLLVNWEDAKDPWSMVEGVFKTKNPMLNEREAAQENMAFKGDRVAVGKEFRKLWSAALKSAGPS